MAVTSDSARWQLTQSTRCCSYSRRSVDDNAPSTYAASQSA
ncbi:Uncharacterised protein [Mycobacteroides abscessus subsp. abscessus]|nr:Uncharacterised protein [Mycobacteroides abscessus subsp. abscessus]